MMECFALLPLSTVVNCPYLLWNLAKVVDISKDCALDEGVFSSLPPSLLLGVEVRMEYVDIFHSSRTLLPVPENQVNPQMEMGAHIVTFQGLRKQWSWSALW